MQTTGRELASLQEDLTTLWQTEGPDTVLAYLEHADPAVVRALVMANVGAAALRPALR